MSTPVLDSGIPDQLPSTAGGAEPFRIEEERPAGDAVALFVVFGELDLHAAPELRERLTDAIEGGATHVVLDLARVTFIDSMGLGVLLGALKRLRPRGGQLQLVVPRSEVRRIFEITLLDQVFSLTHTRNEALAAYMEPWGG